MYALDYVSHAWSRNHSCPLSRTVIQWFLTTKPSQNEILCIFIFIHLQVWIKGKTIIFIFRDITIFFETTFFQNMQCEVYIYISWYIIRLSDYRAYLYTLPPAISLNSNERATLLKMHIYVLCLDHVDYGNTRSWRWDNTYILSVTMIPVISTFEWCRPSVLTERCEQFIYCAMHALKKPWR